MCMGLCMGGAWLMVLGGGGHKCCVLLLGFGGEED